MSRDAETQTKVELQSSDARSKIGVNLSQPPRYFRGLKINCTQLKTCRFYSQDFCFKEGK